MKKFYEKVGSRIESLNSELQQLFETNPNAVVGEISFKQLLGGMRGMKSLICNTSYVDPYKGLYVSGMQIPEFEDRSPEEIFYLLTTGQLPNATQLQELQGELAANAEVPGYVWDIVRAAPKSIHPMTLFSLAILAMEGESVFKQKYAAGIPKSDYWKYTLQDSIALIAKLPSLAAGIYRILFLDGKLIDYNPQLDFAGNMTQMLGINQHDDSFADLLRLYLVLHCDHEGGNVSAFTSRVVNSALSNIYYATSAGLNGLAGPLHGLANQVCLHFITDLHDKLGNDPSVEEVREFALLTLNSGKVIPGYGHAVLRATDPRFTSFLKFGDQHCAHSPYLQTVKKLFAVVPDILSDFKGGKVANPWPNVDAISGSLLYHYGMTHYDFYTVMFGVSRTLGFCAQNTIARGMNQPIIRPKSVTNNWLSSYLNNEKKAATL